MNRIPPLSLLYCLFAVCTAESACAQQQSSAAAVGQYRVAAKYQKLEQYDLAAKEWKKLVADFPDDPLAASGLHYGGVCHFQLGDYKAATTSFEQFVAKYPEHELLEPTLTNLGLAHYNLATRAQGEKANRLYDQAIATFDLEAKKFTAGKYAAQSNFYRGEALYALGKLPEAAEQYRSWLANHGDSKSPLKTKVQLALGSTLQERGQHSKAIAALTQLAESQPPSDVAAEAALRLGESLAATEQFGEAAVQFAKAAATPNFTDADFAMHGEATALFQSGDFANAADVYASLAQRFPKSTLADESIALAGKSYYQAKNYPKAAEHLGRAYDTSDHDAELAHWLIRTQMELGQNDRAVAIADNLLASKNDANVLLDKANALYALDARRSESVNAYIAAANAAAGDESDQARHLAAATALELQNYKMAIDQARRLVSDNPNSNYAADARQTLAEAQLQSGDAANAVATYRELLKNAQPPQRPAWSLRMAWALSAAGDELAITELLPPVIDQFTGEEQMQASFLLGRALFRTEDYAGALTPLKVVAGASPPTSWSAESTLLLARSLAATDDVDAATATLDKLIDSNPQATIGARAYFRRAQFYDTSDNLSAARSDYQRLATQWPEHTFVPYANYRLGEMNYDDGKYGEALPAFEQVVSHPKASESLKEKAQHLAAWSKYKSGAATDAAAQFQSQLAAHPDGPLAPDARWMIGESHFAAEQYAAALDAYQKAQSAGPPPDNLAALAMLHAGQAAGQVSKWEESSAWLEKTLSEHPDFAGRSEAEYELAWTMSKLGKRDEAMPLLQKVAEENSPLGARAMFVKGELQFADKQYEDAVRTFFQVAYGYGDRKAAQEFHPWQAEALFEAARCLEQLNRQSAAKKLYAELVERFPNEAKAKLAQQRLAELTQAN